MRGELSFACTFKDDGPSGVTIITTKPDMPAGKQSEVLWSHGELGLHDCAVCSQIAS